MCSILVQRIQSNCDAPPARSRRRPLPIRLRQRSHSRLHKVQAGSISRPAQPNAGAGIQTVATQTPFNSGVRPGGIPNPAAQLPGGSATGSFLIDPPTMTLAKGATFTVNVMVTGAQNVYSVPLQLSYDPNQLQVVNVSNGGFLSQDGQAVALVHRDDPTTGTLQVTASRPPGVGGVSGQGAVVTLTFMAKSAGQSALTITRGGARDPAMQPIAMNGAQAAITIQ